MTDDLKAPERIWVTHEDHGASWSGSFRGFRASSLDHGDEYPEYVRADRIATLEAALADMTQQRDEALTLHGAEQVLHDYAKEERDAAMAGVVKVHYYCTDCCVNTAVSSENRCLSCGGGRVMATYKPDPDRMLALTAAAYEDAAEQCGERRQGWLKPYILARIPPDALAAQARIEAQAEARGMRKAAGEIANLPTPTREDIAEGHEQAYRAVISIADATEAADKGGV